MDSHELRGDQADTHRIVTPDLCSSQSLDRAAFRKHCNAERLVAASPRTGHFASGMEFLSSEQAWFR